MAIKAVIFDLGDTILNFGRLSLNRLFAEGARLTYDYLVSLVGAGALPEFGRYKGHNTRAIKRHYIWSRLIQREFDCLGLLRKDTRRMGLALSECEIEELAWLWYKPLADSGTLESDVHDALTALQEMGLELAILSNTFVPASAHDRHLAELELLQFFDVRVYSSDTIFRKPDRRIFRHTLGLLDVEPGEALMVGDRWIFDVYGARKVGIQPVYKRSLVNQHKRVFASSPEIDKINELPGLVERLNAGQ